MTMLEKVARALFALSVRKTPNLFIANSWDDLAALVQGHYINMAEAAIEAMRESTPEMQRRARAQLGLSPYDKVSVQYAWNDMIDAALNEKA